MKGLVFKGKQNMEIQDMDKPQVKPNEVLVNSKYAGICGTDNALYNGLPGSADAVPGTVFGHETSGVVEEVGSDVKKFKKGDRVTVDPNIYCGSCKYCQTDRPELCENLSAVGVTRNGGLEDYYTAPETNVYKVPENVSLKDACATEPISCALHGVNLLTLSPYQKALVIGDGFEGLIFAQLLRAYGVHHVDITGRHDDKLAKNVKNLGLTHGINTTKEDINEKYDVIIEAVGTPATQEQAIESTEKGAQVLMFGVGSPDQKFSINTYEVFQKQLTIRGSFINPYEFPNALAMLSSDEVDIDSIIDNVISLEDVEPTLSGKAKRRGKNVVKIND